MKIRTTLALTVMATAWITVATLVAQNTPAPAAQAAAAQPPRVAQGGRGPLRVLFISKGHDFDRDGLMTMLDQLGTDITWTHVEHPAAELFYDPKNGTDYDAYLLLRRTESRKSDAAAAEWRAGLSRCQPDGEEELRCAHRERQRPGVPASRDRRVEPHVA